MCRSRLDIYTEEDDVCRIRLDTVLKKAVAESRDGKVTGVECTSVRTPTSADGIPHLSLRHVRSRYMGYGGKGWEVAGKDGRWREAAAWDMAGKDAPSLASAAKHAAVGQVG